MHKSRLLTRSKVIIFRERESKRYDFEAQSVAEAAEIVEEITKGMEPYHPQQRSTA